MPVVKFDQPDTLSDNRGSCRQYVSYLSKEDQWKGIDKEFFFNDVSLQICDYEVIDAIDKNKFGLGNEQAKFYTGSINFSEDELAFINNDTDKIKLYTIGVMEKYAENFNKGLIVSDVNWFAKLETNRYYKGDDPEVINGSQKQGDIKPGNNIHVHFIIGRKSKDSALKLSPVTNHINTQSGPVRGGFSRDTFKENSEKLFDQLFEYIRPYEDLYQTLKSKKNGEFSEKEKIMDETAYKKAETLKYGLLNENEKIEKLKKLIGYIEYGIDRDNPIKLNRDEFINKEIAYNYDGSVYKGLLNLNVRMKNGFKPDPSTVNDYLNNYIDYFHGLKGNKTSNNTIEIQSPSKIISSQHSEKSFVAPSIPEILTNTLGQNKENDELPEFLRRKKKNLDRNRGNDFSR
jgi:hypothetical protein